MTILEQLGQDIANAIVEKYGSFSEASSLSGIHRTSYTRLRTAPTWSNVGNMIERHGLNVRFCIGEFDISETSKMDIQPEIADYIVNRLDSLLSEKYQIKRTRKPKSNQNEWLDMFNL
ncbi:hypothetical protein QEF67_003185 [Klebsiella aerogenes]|uniref:hypothetical protein n=1 Tax=Klebsiella aerogenes TaxID=548 RepID=UPI002A255192|nr:hypothetical protein [Klebsiella aerogenes]